MLKLPTIAAKDISVGQTHICAVTMTGTLYCWGHNNSSQLGDQSTTQRSSPKRIEAEAGWSAVAVGDYHTCGLREGNLLCWGLNDYGQLGDGMRNRRYYSNPI